VARYRYLWIAVADRENRYTDVGFVLRSGSKRVEWIERPGYEGTAPHVQRMIGAALGSGSVEGFWTYLQDRGIGSSSSVADERKIEAATWDQAVEKILARADQVSHRE
jgi:hypothetical protein